MADNSFEANLCARYLRLSRLAFAQISHFTEFDMGEASEGEQLPDLALFSSTLAAISGSADSVANLLSSTELPDYSNGISLLSLKNNLLLSYMHNMTLLLLQRLHGRSLVEGNLTENGNTVRKALVERLIQERIMLEKIKPLEVRLRYQVDKLVKKAENADRIQAEGGDEAQLEDDIANGTHMLPNIVEKVLTCVTSRSAGLQTESSCIDGKWRRVGF